MDRTVLLALAAAVYPTLLAGVIVIIGQPRPRPLLFGFLIGGFTISVLAGLVVVAAIRQSDHVVDVSHTTRPALSIMLGLLSLGAAVALWTKRGPRFEGIRRRRDQRAQAKSGGPNWTERILGRGSIAFAVAAGALLNLPGVWYLAALSDIATVTPAGARVVQILVFNLIMFVLVEIPLLMYVFDEERAQMRVTRFDAWVRGHKREVGVGIALVVGVYLVIRGAVAISG